MSRRGLLRRHAVAVNLAFILGLLGLASLVPPDGSLAAIRERGVLRVCTPVQGVGEAEAARLAAFAAAIPARLLLAPLASIGADANPRNWRITRAQCDMIAGGLADTPATRSFLTVVPIGVETGWAVWPGPLAACRQALVWPGASGLGRVALSGFLRAQNVPARLAPDLPAAMAEAQSGQGICVVASLPDLMRHTSPDSAPQRLDMPGAEPARLGFGLWKGDATLARRLRNVMTVFDK